MKKPYEKPEMEIVSFEIEENIAGMLTSGITFLFDPFEDDWL